MFNDYEIHKLATQLPIAWIKLFISIVISPLPIMDILRQEMPVNICIFVKLEEENVSILLQSFLRQIN